MRTQELGAEKITRTQEENDPDLFHHFTLTYGLLPLCNRVLALTGLQESFSVVKDLMCARAIPEASVDANCPYRGGDVGVRSFSSLLIIIDIFTPGT